MWDRAAKTLRCDFPTCERTVSLYRTLTPQTAVVARQQAKKQSWQIVPGVHDLCPDHGVTRTRSNAWARAAADTRGRMRR